MNEKQILRILDANFNRSREGLRVCEEIARFVLGDRALTKRLKKTRHSVSACVKQMPVPLTRLVGARDVRSDVGKESSRLEGRRHSALDLFAANIERAKESLRVLEETSKLMGSGIPERIKRIRFYVYAIEKKALPRLESLCDHAARRGQGRVAH